jgi:NADH:ubiquinone oxidoreductase subunit D
MHAAYIRPGGVAQDLHDSNNWISRDGK